MKEGDKVRVKASASKWWAKAEGIITGPYENGPQFDWWVQFDRDDLPDAGLHPILFKTEELEVIA